jgi:hypothetical protein
VVGSGIAVADIDGARVPPADPVPSRYWLHRRGLPGTVAWHTQRVHGRRWYARNVRGRPAYEAAAAPPGSAAKAAAGTT